MRVRVHRNLNRNCWSIVNPKTGRVMQWADHVSLKDAKFVVRPGGRARVLKNQRRNVHAFAIGELTGFHTDQLTWYGAYYNPYEAEHFLLEDGLPIYTAEGVILNENGQMFVGVKDG